MTEVSGWFKSTVLRTFPSGVLNLITTLAAPAVCEGKFVRRMRFKHPPKAVVLSHDGACVYVVAAMEGLAWQPIHRVVLTVRADLGSGVYDREWLPEPPEAAVSDVSIGAMALCADGSVWLRWDSPPQRLSSMLLAYSHVGGDKLGEVQVQYESQIATATASPRVCVAEDRTGTLRLSWYALSNSAIGSGAAPSGKHQPAAKMVLVHTEGRDSGSPLEGIARLAADAQGRLFATQKWSKAVACLSAPDEAAAGSGGGLDSKGSGSSASGGSSGGGGGSGGGSKCAFKRKIELSFEIPRPVLDMDAKTSAAASAGGGARSIEVLAPTTALCRLGADLLLVGGRAPAWGCVSVVSLGLAGSGASAGGERESVRVLSQFGQRRGEWDSFKQLQPGELGGPCSVAGDAFGCVWVADGTLWLHLFQ